MRNFSIYRFRGLCLLYVDEDSFFRIYYPRDGTTTEHKGTGEAGQTSRNNNTQGKKMKWTFPSRSKRKQIMPTGSSMCAWQRNDKIQHSRVVSYENKQNQSHWCKSLTILRRSRKLKATEWKHWDVKESLANTFLEHKRMCFKPWYQSLGGYFSNPGTSSLAVPILDGKQKRVKLLLATRHSVGNSNASTRQRVDFRLSTLWKVGVNTRISWLSLWLLVICFQLVSSPFDSYDVCFECTVSAELHELE